GHDFGSEATLDAFKQQMQHYSAQHGNPYDAGSLLHFLDGKSAAEPWHATNLLWTLSLSGITRYVIRPAGPYARECYDRLRYFYSEQVRGEVVDGQPNANRKVERVAVPGVIVGQATLLSGRSVPVIEPDLRGFCNWSIADIIKAVVDGPNPHPNEAD